MRSVRRVRHPLTGEKVSRAIALSQVRMVSSEVRSLLTKERVRLGLSLNDLNPTSKDDRRKYNETVDAVQNQ